MHGTRVSRIHWRFLDNLLGVSQFIWSLLHCCLVMRICLYQKMLRFHNKKLGSQRRPEKKITKNSLFVMMMSSCYCCDRSVEVGWTPSQICSSVDSDDATLAPTEYEKVYSSHNEGSQRAWWLPNRAKNGLKESEKETDMGFLWWIWGGSGVRIPARSLDFLLMPREGVLGFSHQLTQMWGKRRRVDGEA